MLTINDLKKDTVFITDNAPCKVLEIQHKKMARQGATTEVKYRNLITGVVITKTFFPSHKFEQGEVTKQDLLFIYSHKGQYVFCDPNNKSNRIQVQEHTIGEQKKYLIPQTTVHALYHNNQIIDITLPIKVDIKVIDAPPNIKGNSASSPTKTAVIETGATIQVPIFINTGDTIRVNTQKGEYAERIKKS